MRNRKRFSGPKTAQISEKDKVEIYDLFELSTLTVKEIADAYGLSRLTVYRIVWKKEGIEDKSRRKNGNSR